MKKHKSFTLIEMLVVIFILVLLIGIIIVIFQRGNYEAKQNDNRRKKEIAEIATAVEAFKADKGHYPLINWGPGIHAYQTAALGSYNGHNECNGTFGSDYTAFTDKYNEEDPDGAGPLPVQRFDPGTEIRFIEENNLPCDDLSLQLLGLAYLPKMPNDDPDTQGYDAPNDAAPNGLWNFTNLKPYLDEIPKDPLLMLDENHWYVFQTTAPYPGAIATADYDPVGIWLYRYLYNSYYSCASEEIYPGERYWMNAIMQLRASGDFDDPANPDLNGTGLYFYELGTANWFRYPRSLCGTIAMGGSAPQVTVQAVPDNMTLPATNTSTLTGNVTDDPGDTHTFQWSGSAGVTFTGSTTTQNTTVSFSAAGTYTLTLAATDNSGLTGTSSDTVIVNPAAAPQYGTVTLRPDGDILKGWGVIPNDSPYHYQLLNESPSAPNRDDNVTKGFAGTPATDEYTLSDVAAALPADAVVESIVAHFYTNYAGPLSPSIEEEMIYGGQTSTRTGVGATDMWGWHEVTWNTSTIGGDPTTNLNNMHLRIFAVGGLAGAIQCATIWIEARYKY